MRLLDLPSPRCVDSPGAERGTTDRDAARGPDVVSMAHEDRRGLFLPHVRHFAVSAPAHAYVVRTRVRGPAVHRLERERAVPGRRGSRRDPSEARLRQPSQLTARFAGSVMQGQGSLADRHTLVFTRETRASIDALWD